MAPLPKGGCRRSVWGICLRDLADDILVMCEVPAFPALTSCNVAGGLQLLHGAADRAEPVLVLPGEPLKREVPVVRLPEHVAQQADSLKAELRIVKGCVGQDSVVLFLFNADRCH